MSALADLVGAGVVDEHVELARLTTYKLGGPARWFAEVGSAELLERVASAARDDGVPVLVLGRGSNLVVSDLGFDGLVIRLGAEFGEIEHAEAWTRAGGAVPLPMLARSCVKEGRLGLEFFVGIPGTVGGAVRQNAGCHGSETAEWLIDADVLSIGTGARSARTPSDLSLAYRHSALADDDVVLSARFRFEAGDRPEGERRMRAVTRWRKDHQPGGTLNAGSVFKNPPGDAAGRIIDSLGLKGFTVGGARVSDRHANFFEAGPEATAADVHRLVGEVRRRVREETGIDLSPEIRFVGRFDH